MSRKFVQVEKPDAQQVFPDKEGLAVEVKRVIGGMEFCPLVWSEDWNEYQGLDSLHHFVIPGEFDETTEPMFIKYKKD